MDKNKALKLWDDVFGANTMFALDCFGTYICREDYGDYERQRRRPGGDGNLHQYGWDVDHIRPVANFPNESDADFWNNYEPMHRGNNVEKGDNYPQFYVKDKKYKVIVCTISKGKGCKGYGIEDESTGKRVDWKGVTNRSYNCQLKQKLHKNKTPCHVSFMSRSFLSTAQLLVYKNQIRYGMVWFKINGLLVISYE